MKTAIYIEDGTVQLVLTPETEFEKSAVATLMKEPIEAQLFSGSFYDCRGGWVRQTAYYSSSEWGGGSRDECSIILRVGDKKTLAEALENAVEIRTN